MEPLRIQEVTKEEHTHVTYVVVYYMIVCRYPYIIQNVDDM